MKLFDTLISAAELATAIATTPAEALVVLDCRAELGNPAAGPKAWAAGHIPNAQHANLETDLAAPAHSRGDAGGGRHPLPERASLIECCSNWGLNQTTQVVTYDDAGGAYAARAWWLLRWLGHRNVAVLDGGIQAWQTLPNTQLSQTSTPVVASRFEASEPLTRIASLAEVETAVAKKAAHATPPPTQLIDARAQARFNGEMEPIDPVAGHIPGAQCFPFSGNLGTSGLFLTPKELRTRFAALASSEKSSSEVICYCGSGVTAAHNVLAMRIAGLPEPKLYVGSWSEWCADPRRAQATGA